MISLDCKPRHREVIFDKISEEAIDGILPAEDIAAADIVASEDKDVRVLVADDLLKKSSPIGVTARVALLRRGDVLTEEVPCVVHVRHLDLEKVATEKRKK